MSAGNKKYTDTEIMFGALDRIVREEMKKRPSKRDEALIDECIAEMAKLKGVRAGYTEEEIGAIVEKLEARAATSKKKPERPGSVRRVTAAVCAACLIMVGSITCVAWNPFCVVKDWIVNIIDTSSGTVEDVGDITYSNYGEVVKYDCIQDLLKKEQLKIYYPAVLPEEVFITTIETLNLEDNEYVRIRFNNSDYQFIIQFNTSLYMNTPEYETIKTNDVSFYVSHQNDRYVAQCNIDTDVYLIECSDYQDILLIINNFKKGY